MLLSETRVDARFYYEYDANGTLYAVTYIASSSATPVTYYYLHNSRGDIESIYNSNGELIASYKYDSWGKVLSVKDANGNAITDQSHIANLNPFRYRSYYYDTETGLYYLMSRYYDPETGRFINADGYVSTGTGLLDTNMFAYCGNNPISNVDPTGSCFEKRYTNVGTYIGTYWILKVPVPGVPKFCHVCKMYEPENQTAVDQQKKQKSTTKINESYTFPGGGGMSLSATFDKSYYNGAEYASIKDISYELFGVNNFDYMHIALGNGIKSYNDDTTAVSGYMTLNWDATATAVFPIGVSATVYLTDGTSYFLQAQYSNGSSVLESASQSLN